MWLVLILMPISDGNARTIAKNIYYQFLRKSLSRNISPVSCFARAALSIFPVFLPLTETRVNFMPAQAAWIAATKTLSAELGPQGVRVNAIAPGVIRTAMTAALSRRVMARQMARCELKRPGLPEEVANTLLWLASDAQLYRALVIRIDGGMG
jgi:NAD(P)-dependent dehydrogenase (short-subunit alcohol dehydrogenase family)